MTLVVYAIIEAGSPAIEERGLDGHPLRTVGDEDLAAVVSEHDGSRIAGSAANLWDYEQVMERLMSDRAILPMQFGSALADERAVRAMLRERAEQLRAGLERVRGAVEVGVRAGWRDSPPRDEHAAANGGGTAYMLERLALHRQACDLVDRLDPLAGLARDIHIRFLGQGELPVHEAYLVNRDRVKEFAERVRDIDERHPEIELVCTGPWPPYSFAAVSDERRGGRR
jgi:hypothetical protein